MLIIGENIHIIAPEVKEAIGKRDTEAIQGLAKAQEHGVAVGTNLGIGHPVDKAQHPDDSIDGCPAIGASHGNDSHEIAVPAPGHPGQGKVRCGPGQVEQG